MKQDWKPGTMIYPLPAVLVSCGKEESEYNIITVAWTGTICTNPPMCYISVRPERYSHEIIKKNMEFVINLTTKDMIKANKVLQSNGTFSAVPEMTMEYAVVIAASATGIPVEFYNNLSPRDAIKPKTKVTGFFFGEE